MTWISRWEMECQDLTNSEDKHPDGVSARSPSPSSPSVIRTSNEVPLASALGVGNKARTEVGDGLGQIASSAPIADVQGRSECLCSGFRTLTGMGSTFPALSTSEAISTLGPEEEDPTFPVNSLQPPLALDGPPRPSLSPTEDPVVPAIRRLEEASLPPAKKRRLARGVDISPQDEIDLGTRKLRSATARPPEPTLPATPGRLPVSPTADLAPGPSVTVAKRTRSATAAAAAAKSVGSTTKKARASGSSTRKGRKNGGD